LTVLQENSRVVSIDDLEIDLVLEDMNTGALLAR
jgi:hypothetical protein